MEIRESAAEEALLQTLDGFVAEGTVSNVFMVKQGTLITPPLSLGILDGITRREILRIAGAQGIPIQESLFTPEEMGSAEECLLTSTTYEVMPVINVGGRTIRDGRPGILSRGLLEEYRRRTKAV
jgi:branched-chain amino acid aminotransferase